MVEDRFAGYFHPDVFHHGAAFALDLGFGFVFGFDSEGLRLPGMERRSCRVECRHAKQPVRQNQQRIVKCCGPVRVECNRAAIEGTTVVRVDQDQVNADQLLEALHVACQHTVGAE